ncbi:dephospho-CoA kinase [Fulvimarina sp. 2208YS6-2-32]|uniref:Dephospho-CoA kinase n=1 Tax=Fulvimarina uroteuthidis TaxID=3098149 RepID=A0ABU5HY10_9HYPH|nr:dephospho-CoA kinase [Fulvimarina sp. 2208YS6-2-32]MDY8108028.1 dephospho-CoA kinase [Fulvimarina sp. 2208YS6-2-32]
MIVLGLTGSIGMGKSTTAEMFADEGVPVHSADAAVHRLYAGLAAPLIEAAFPGTVTAGVVDRRRLGAAVVGNREAMRRLEAIVHPLVREEEETFIDAARRSGADMVVLDIPLLFETGAETRCDKVLVVSAPPAVQRARVLARPGMSEAAFDAILASQLPDAQKRARADFVIDTAQGLEPARRRVREILSALRAMPVASSAQDR